MSLATVRPALRSAAGLLLTVAVLSLAFGSGLVWLISTVCSVALVIAGPKRTVVSAMPLAMAVVIGGLMAITTLTGAIQVPILADGRYVLVAGLIVSVVVAAAVMRRPIGSVPMARSRELVALAPAGVCSAAAVLLEAGSRERRFGWLLQSWDGVTHTLFVGEIQSRGYLSYNHEGYPRGWHSVVAWLVDIQGHGPTVLDASTLSATMSAEVMIGWLTYVGLVAAIGLTTFRLATASMTGRPTFAALTGSAAGALAMTTPFLTDTMAYGYQTAALAALGLAAAALAAVALVKGDPTQIAVLGACVVIVAGSWQLMVPAVVAIAAIPAIGWSRQQCGGRAGGASTIVLVPWLVACLAAALLPCIAVVRWYGLSHAATGGTPSAHPWLLTLLGGLAGGLVIARPGGRRSASLPLALGFLVAAAIAFGLAAMSGVALSDYYPTKVLWFTTLIGLPLVADLVIGSAIRLGFDFRSRAIRVGMHACMIATCGVLLAVATAVTVSVIVTPRPYSADQSRSRNGVAWAVIPVVVDDDAESASLVLTDGHRWDDFVARSLVQYFHVAAAGDIGQIMAGQYVPAICQRLGHEDRPVVRGPVGARKKVSRAGCSAETMDGILWDVTR